MASKKEEPTFYELRICPNRKFEGGRKQCKAIVPVGPNEYARCCNYTYKSYEVCYVHREMGKRPKARNTGCMVAVVDRESGRQRCCHNSTKDGLTARLEGDKIYVCAMHYRMIKEGKTEKMSRCRLRRGRVVEGPKTTRVIGKNGQPKGFKIVSQKVRIEGYGNILFEVTTGAGETTYVKDDKKKSSESSGISVDTENATILTVMQDEVANQIENDKDIAKRYKEAKEEIETQIAESETEFLTLKEKLNKASKDDKADIKKKIDDLKKKIDTAKKDKALSDKKLKEIADRLIRLKALQKTIEGKFS